MDEASTTIMAAFSTLTQPELAAVTSSIGGDFLRRRRRVVAILTSPARFSATIRRLRHLSLPAVVASHLLRCLRRLVGPTAGPAPANEDLDDDASALLLLICHARPRLPHKSPPSQWRQALVEVYVADMLVGPPCTSLLLPCLEEVARCAALVSAAASESESEYAVAAAEWAVVGLPAVEYSGGEGGECVICKEEMGGEGSSNSNKGVCKLPCGHVFHRKCVLTWLSGNNTCPSCRFRLPTDGVFAEIRRLWDVLLRMAGGTGK